MPNNMTRQEMTGTMRGKPAIWSIEVTESALVTRYGAVGGKLVEKRTDRFHQKGPGHAHAEAEKRIQAKLGEGWVRAKGDPVGDTPMPEVPEVPRWEVVRWDGDPFDITDASGGARRIQPKHIPRRVLHMVTEEGAGHVLVRPSEASPWQPIPVGRSPPVCPSTVHRPDPRNPTGRAWFDLDGERVMAEPSVDTLMVLDGLSPREATHLRGVLVRATAPDGMEFPPGVDWSCAAFVAHDGPCESAKLTDAKEHERLL